MAVMKRRARLVTFRVSSDEYDLLQGACVASSSRSISDFARAAVLYRVRMLQAPQGMLVSDLATLSKQLLELDEALESLHGRIRQVLGSVKPDHQSTLEAGG